MVVKCIECGKFLSPLSPDAAVCAECKQCRHKVCVSLPVNVPVSTSWTCRECTERIKSRNKAIENSDTQTASDDESSPAADPPSAGLDKTALNTPVVPSFSEWKEVMSGLMERICDDLKQDLSCKLGALTEEFQAFRLEMLEVRGAVQACNDRMDKLEKRMDALEIDHASTGEDKEVRKVVQTLEATVTQLKLDLSDREQELLLNDLDITGITEESGENPVHLAITCAGKLGVKLDERDIVSSARVGADFRNEDGTPRPRPIAVRLARRATRDAILSSARVRRGVTTEGVGTREEPQRFYVNERLTKRNRALFSRARKLRSAADWKHAWTRDGKIFVRQAQGTTVYRIRSEADLERVFGVELVRTVAAS